MGSSWLLDKPHSTLRKSHITSDRHLVFQLNSFIWGPKCSFGVQFTSCHTLRLFAASPNLPTLPAVWASPWYRWHFLFRCICCQRRPAVCKTLGIQVGLWPHPNFLINAWVTANGQQPGDAGLNSQTIKKAVFILEAGRAGHVIAPFGWKVPFLPGNTVTRTECQL